MTKLRTDKKAHTLGGAAALIIAAFFTLAAMAFTACKQPTEPTATPKHKVTFSVDGGGTLTAKIDETEIKSGDEVEENKTVTFTAAPTAGFKIKGWTLDGKAVNGTDNSYQLKIEKAVTVKVSFEAIPPTKYTVTLNQTTHGKVTASPEIPADGKVGENTVITFTAEPDNEYKVDKWTITGGVFEAGTGTDGSLTAKVKVNANITVTVSFKSLYVQVAYDKLAEYLTNTASEVSYIEVTGLKPEYLIGDDSGHTTKPSPLGAILQAHQTKKVALKLGESVSALMDMSFCFYGCTSLVGVAAIPKGVKDMTSCFDSCTSLMQAPVLPESVTKMNGCFRDCKSLTKAPAIPKGVEDMKSCFASCTNLTQAPAIPESVQNMRQCFYKCSSLVKAPAIPEGVKDMSYCFQNCTTLTKAPASIPASVENMSQCFQNCTSLTETPASISASVKDMSQCFQNCTSLTQVPAISEGVENMAGCFWGCTSLTKAPAIPASVTEMSGCFRDCKVLTSVTLKCNYGAGKFGIAFKDCKALREKSIKVPQAYYDAYTTAEALNSMAVPGADEAEKKAKFEGV